MSSEKITAEKRTEFGKGAARRIRRENKIPAVIYGHGAEPIHVTLPGHDTMMALKHHGQNALLELDIDGKTQLALTKQVQIDHIRRVIEHVDFVAVKAGEKVTVEVPVHVVGESAPGTLVVTDHAAIAVEAEATHVPEGLEISVEGAEAGTQIHAKDIALPQGVTLVLDADTLVVNVTAAPTAAQVEAELESAEAEAGIVHEASEAETEAAAATEAE
ncbi:50S ribosomal protein L25/general stress protein Ctc [Nocardioides sp.]|jgi:large subunit ribosomal protein L25|uniref:50S ribosomal protein L25/general stress protein Ctc n=1 Tax=Nocardioides sp. TaxID=35761 RepID=UPI002CA0F98F|nr:50S ribosomal protein L25/general stress protein Ctc [Nocardioides sp.]HVX55461.1 50S ribosomal protein L25/general stress protein Ctc [Nocardioides sp.]